LASGIRDRQPHWLKDAQHKGAIDRIDGLGANDREDMVLDAGKPSGMALVFPAPFIAS
jgi:hypothetical protein